MNEKNPISAALKEFDGKELKSAEVLLRDKMKTHRLQERLRSLVRDSGERDFVVYLKQKWEGGKIIICVHSPTEARLYRECDSGTVEVWGSLFEDGAGSLNQEFLAHSVSCCEKGQITVERVKRGACVCPRMERQKKIQAARPPLRD